MGKTDMLANTKRAVDAARTAGLTVMHAPITFAEGYGELSDHPYGILIESTMRTGYEHGYQAAFVFGATSSET